MQLSLERLWKSDVCTIGRLTVDGNHDYFTLEDVEREIDGRLVQEWKVDGKTAIPRGKYKVEITYSPRFHRYMPEILNVPGFKGVRIHPGNTHVDTEGCLLVGMSKGPDCIYESRKAYDRLYVQIAEALERGETVEIDIT
jgi:hypothetical protein